MDPPSLCTQCRQPWSPGISGAYRTLLRRRPSPFTPALAVAAATNHEIRPCIACAIDVVSTPTLLIVASVASAASSRRANLPPLAHQAVRSRYAQNSGDHGSRHCTVLAMTAVLAELPAVCEPHLRPTGRWGGGSRRRHQTVFALAAPSPGLQRSIGCATIVGCAMQASASKMTRPWQKAVLLISRVSRRVTCLARKIARSLDERTATGGCTSPVYGCGRSSKRGRVGVRSVMPSSCQRRRAMVAEDFIFGLDTGKDVEEMRLRQIGKAVESMEDLLSLPFTVQGRPMLSKGKELEEAGFAVM
ncbi:nitrogen assimilation transcription factor nirA [Fusarium mundagurra]|uniref:Nitrogen assimilation transcription factor nirA n=1 Tax=Fusarium mundagurra TaxID=1567541 RepID=A0A8H6D5A9_9HYPO|nr:nitrogen assimilation transcription factor nirA [Fusarium mundagurra]